MHKKLAVLIGSMGIVASTYGIAEAKYNMAGCGLGASWFEENTVGSQLLAATTNGSSANQTFGITSGTSGCVGDGIVLASKEQEAFFETNFRELQRDIAAAGGEHLAALGQLMACEETALPELFVQAQAAYAHVFPNAQTTPEQALYMLKISLSKNEVLANACGKL